MSVCVKQGGPPGKDDAVSSWRAQPPAVIPPLPLTCLMTLRRPLRHSAFHFSHLPNEDGELNDLESLFQVKKKKKVSGYPRVK